MAAQMTNRLLAMVIAMALSGSLAAHAAQNGQPKAPIALDLGLPSVQALPASLETVATAASTQAQATLDPQGALLRAFQRDHVALEHLRQAAASLRGAAHPALNQLISQDETALNALKDKGLAGADATATITAMDALVSKATASLASALSQAGAAKTPGATAGHPQKP